MKSIGKYLLCLMLALLCDRLTVLAQVEWMETMGLTTTGFNQSADSYISDFKSDASHNIFVLVEIQPGAESSDFIFYANQKILYLPDYYYNGGNNLVLAKFDSMGNLSWSKSLEYLEGDKLAVDSQGNVYVGAGFHKSAVVDGATLSTSSYGFYLAKFSNDGQLQWATTSSGPGQVQVFAMGCDGTGAVYVTGTYEENQLSQDTNVLVSNVSPEIFMMKFSGTGLVKWAENIDFIQFGWTNACSMAKLKFGDDGNIYALFANGGRNTWSSCEYEPWHMMLASITRAGAIILQKDYKCTDLISVSDMDINRFGELMVVGQFRGTFKFGNASIVSSWDAQADCHASDAFLAKFDNNGNILGAEDVSPGASISDYFKILCHDDGSYTIAGMRYYKISYGYPGYNRVFPNGRNRFFIAGYDYSGRLLYSREFYKNISNDWPDYYFDTNPMILGDGHGNFLVADDYKSQYDTFSDCVDNSSQNIILYKLNKGQLKSALQSNESSLVIFPNPASNFIYVETSDSAFRSYSSTIVDMTGRIIYRTDKTDETSDVFKINISSLSSGIYMLIVENSSGRKSLKFVKV